MSDVREGNPICPECVQGKCRNCDGTAWDDIQDVPAQCQCWMNDHKDQPDTPRVRLGSAIHGYANGRFGRDSYFCRIVEAEGTDWFVTRNTRGEAEILLKKEVEYINDPDDRSYCSQQCDARR